MRFINLKIAGFAFLLISCFAFNFSYALDHASDVARGGGGHGGGVGGDRGFDRGFDRGLERGAYDAGGLYYNNPGYGGYNYNYPGYYPYYNQGVNPADADVDQIYKQNQRSMEQGR